jgi:CBS-domain-containing membrane protein
VVDDSGRLVGIVSEADLLIKEGYLAARRQRRQPG